jgi:hypothetical protein
MGLESFDQNTNYYLLALVLRVSYSLVQQLRKSLLGANMCFLEIGRYCCLEDPEF